ncbi:MAG: alpha/beta fold hydrolase [Thermoanaerobaculia bacterium]|nr:alpha/beta fold hydrolase [Thermoanaerobaculia bacterium]
MRRVEFAYLHGFASGPRTEKGRSLGAALSARGGRFEIPDLNRPSVDEITYTGMLEAFDDFVATRPSDVTWGLIGSSMGGLIATRWTELNPDRVGRLALLAPGFDLPSHWQQQLGAEGVRDWREQGFLELPESEGPLRRVHWGLMEDASVYAPFPPVTCPTLILHGDRDDTVPIDSSRLYAASHSNVRLVELDDDHRLLATLEDIEARILEFFAPLLDT